MKSLVLGLLVVILTIAGGAYFFSTQLRKPVVSTQNPQNSSPTVPVVSTTDSPEVNELRAGGSSYRDPAGLFSFLYPNDYKQDIQNGGEVVRVYKQGPTQKGQTEMYDGVIVTFETIALQGKTLSNWVDEVIQQSTADGTSQVTQGKKSMMLGKYPGFTYTIRGLGEFPTIVVQKDITSSQVVRISTLVADPGNQGFQKEVDAILSTVELLK